jgi:hypothetical protein
MEPPAPATHTPEPSVQPHATIGVPAPMGSPARPGAMDALAALVLAPREGGGLREIQAQLQNLYERHRRGKALRERGAISQEEYYVPVELARILVARLEEMDDDLKPQIAQAELEAREAKDRLGYFRDEIEKAKDVLKRHDSSIRIEPSVVADLQNARSAISAKNDEAQEKKVARADLALSQLLKKQGRIFVVIHWADTHFDDLKRNELPQ